jgi:serine/threonine protein kinase
VWQGNPLDLASENGGGRFDAPIEARYELLRRIASGGMAEIYKARHRNLGKEFALKVIHYDGPVEGARLRQLFYREAQLVSRMDHPNIVSVVDFGVDPAHGAYIVMEYLKGETLHQRLKRQHRLRLHTTLEIGLQVAEALHYMHGQGVIHCDVKAENVLLCRAAKDSRQRLVVKMIDFGLSRPRTAGVTLSPAEVGGTPQYMAPELIRGGAPQPSMDIYALGVLVYEMLTGAVPFPGATAADIVQAQLHEEPTAPSALMDEPLESRVEAVVLEALRKDPAKRQPSMGQVIFQLRTLMQMYDLRGARLRHPTPSEQAAVVPPQRASHQLVQGCPFPLFQLDPEGRIVFVNKAFCRFVRGTATELLGQRIGDTRLGVVYPSIQTEAESCGRRSDRIPTRRTFGFELEGGQRVSLMCWLRPETDDQDRVVRVNGYIHGFS